MAFLDFLNTGIGGSQQAQGPNMTGEAGVGPVVQNGPTCNDLARVALQYGSKPGSSGPMLAGMLPASQASQPTTPSTIQPLQPTVMQKTPVEKNAEQSQDSLGKIISMLTALIGL